MPGPLLAFLHHLPSAVAGDAAEPHPCIGLARRMMVPDRSQQAAVLVEAVQNHAPDVIIVDGIGMQAVSGNTQQ